jgi:hypothetical protein
MELDSAYSTRWLRHRQLSLASICVFSMHTMTNVERSDAGLWGVCIVGQTRGLSRQIASSIRGTEMSENRAFQEGYDAYWDGVDPDDNPYRSESAEHFSWDEEWSQAELEDDDVVEE